MMRPNHRLVAVFEEGVNFHDNVMFPVRYFGAVGPGKYKFGIAGLGEISLDRIFRAVL
jgi:hypothetical protein